MTNMSSETNKPSSSLLEKFSPLLVVVAIILAFAVGVLWQKVNNLEKGPTATENTQPTAEKESPLSVDNLKKYAKELGLNEKDFNNCLDSGKYVDRVKADETYGGTVGVSGTPGFFVNGKFLSGAYPFEAFKDIIDKELTGKGSTNAANYIEMLAAAAKTDPKGFDPIPKTVEIGDSPVKGDGKVTIVEFSDFECPYCIRHFTQTYGKLMSEYVNKGLVKYSFKHFPLSFHPNAQKAAEASECAKEQGKFWEMHDKLYSVSN
ncbi:hypothetical protein A2188_01310 [Candidatus Woesebacteria bacterium RIFOXYA1_FULL_43_9]|uniref:Thioredoxin domain-containing protein n=1 Tax=Candidatus Woesebacteria bacterium RIFOXYA1_FULL_43_9 TaxID=1802534 RepID=A0A1F8CMS0_9BACT|nr:MAG: hypothetical protein A2188_01310 [Candidatus Woesebacteria bacterium RIFOXYA1_FULL_43_9]